MLHYKSNYKTPMKTKAIITSCSNKFFPSIINLLGSIKANYPDHPPIYVYDLGLFYTFKKELEKIPGVTLVSMPHFCTHWRSCYTWKTYILAHPFADLNFYIDAGCQVLKPLDEDFDIIEKNDYLIIDVNVTFGDLIPDDYKKMFSVPSSYDNLKGFSAGIFGFKNTESMTQVLHKTYAAALAGLSLGFSPDNLWRNKGKDKNMFIRKCAFFRHDQSLLNLFFRLQFGDLPNVLSNNTYDSRSPHAIPSQRIWHCRLQAKKLEYTKINLLHPDNKINILFHINRILINIVWKYKNLKLWKN